MLVFDSFCGNSLVYLIVLFRQKFPLGLVGENPGNEVAVGQGPEKYRNIYLKGPATCVKHFYLIC